MKYIRSLWLLNYFTPKNINICWMFKGFNLLLFFYISWLILNHIRTQIQKTTNLIQIVCLHALNSISNSFVIFCIVFIHCRKNRVQKARKHALRSLRSRKAEKMLSYLVNIFEVWRIPKNIALSFFSKYITYN